MSYLKAFTTLLSNFLSDLSSVFPDETDLRTCRITTDTMIKANPRIVHKLFIKYVMPYKQQIMDDLSRAETFFLNHSFDKEQTQAASDNMNLLEAVHIKQLWGAMSSSSKESTHKYLCQLIQLAERV